MTKFSAKFLLAAGLLAPAVLFGSELVLVLLWVRVALALPVVAPPPLPA